MITIAEVPEYIREVKKLMTEEERQDIINYLAAHPKSVDLIEGTGVFVKYAGGVVDAVKAVECGLFTTTTVS